MTSETSTDPGKVIQENPHNPSHFRKKMERNFVNLTSITKMNQHLIKMREISRKIILDEWTSIGNNDDDFKQLAKALKNSYTSTEFNLFCYSNCITDKAVHMIIESLKTLKGLKTIKLGFYKCKKITDDSLSHLGKAIKILTSLEKIHLSFTGCSNLIESAASQRILKNLKTQTSLKALQISFTNFTDATILSLGKALKSLKAIQSLELNLGMPEKLTDRALKNLEKDLSALTSLKEFSFILTLESENRLAYDTLQVLSQVLKNLTSLRSLHLHLEKFFPSQEMGFSTINNALQTLISLQHLTLEFPSCYHGDDEALEDLGQALQALNPLKSLNLDFSSSLLLTDNGLQNLKQGLIRHISLESIGLNFSTCQNITDTGLQEISEALRAFPSLQRISLNCEACPEITNITMENLSQILQTQTSLTSLKFDFSNCNKITNTSLESLSETLETLTSLKDIFFRFVRNYASISDSGVKALIQAVGKLHNLAHIILDFSECYQVNHAAFETINDHWTNLTSFEDVLLVYTCYHSLNDQTIQYTEKAWKRFESGQPLRFHCKYCPSVTDQDQGN